MCRGSGNLWEAYLKPRPQSCIQMRKSETNSAKVQVSAHSRWRCLQQGSLEEMQMVHTVVETKGSVTIWKRCSWSSKQKPAHEEQRGGG